MSKKLLIVDDSWGCSDLYRLRFEYANWEVAIAYSAEEAIEKMKNNNLPDVILLDLMLPKMQGDELLEIIRTDQRTKDIVVIVLTALSLNPIDQEKFEGKADDYILKIDILPEQLVNRVNEILKKKQLN
ncbi:MAG: response regulator [bacterium]